MTSSSELFNHLFSTSAGHGIHELDSTADDLVLCPGPAYGLNMAGKNQDPGNWRNLLPRNVLLMHTLCHFSASKCPGQHWYRAAVCVHQVNKQESHFQLESANWHPVQAPHPPPTLSWWTAPKSQVRSHCRFGWSQPNKMQSSGLLRTSPDSYNNMTPCFLRWELYVCLKVLCHWMLFAKFKITTPQKRTDKIT